MMNELSRNEVELDGSVLSAPEFSHENHGARFYRILLRVPRLSGQADTLPVIVPEPLLSCIVPKAELHIRGQLRSFNNKSGAGSRLVLTVYARSADPGGGEPLNRIFLSGVLCKPPVLRRTPLGRCICDMMLAVSRHYGRADYLPVIAWGQLAVLVSRRNVGDRVSLEGRVQSRIYTKVTDSGPEERTAYEVSVMHLREEENEPASE
jgi:hypothetical protein